MDETMNKSVQNASSEVFAEAMNLDKEKQQMADEFNTQRARMKEMFLQKEEEVKRLSSEKQELELELEDVKEQLMQLQILNRNQQSEIENLQYLVYETVEASSSAANTEAKTKELQLRCLELEQKINLMNKQAANQEMNLAPSVLVQAVTKSLARKLGADANTNDLEDSMKKAQEDAEMLKSLVVPLEEEIKALKDKLRDTDTQLQQQLKMKKSGKPEGVIGCDMCENYEAQLVAEQEKCRKEQKKAQDNERALLLAKEELERCNSIQAETLHAWSNARSETEDLINDYEQRLSQCEKVVVESEKRCSHACAKALQRVTSMTVARDQLQRTIDELSEQNAQLLGKFLERSQNLQNENIDLPDSVEDLQELCLKLREELIVCCVGREVACDEQLFYRDKFAECARNLDKQTADAQQTRAKLEELLAERGEVEAFAQRLKQVEAELETKSIENTRLNSLIEELKIRVSALQQELNTSEKVQMDFVRLSQSLQVELERIRKSEVEVRWQDEDDINSCCECKKELMARKEKYHCRHCGRILCNKCLSKSVPSGARKLPARVCDVCYTLLQPHTPPYFSQQ